MQIFFISPSGYLPVKNSGVKSTHGWMDDGAVQIIGVVECTGDGEKVATALEAAGCLILPDQRYGATLPAEVVTALSKYDVTASDTTATAMGRVVAKSGFNPHRVKRFQ
jgi:hypothetical protein